MGTKEEGGGVASNVGEERLDKEEGCIVSGLLLKM